MKPKDPYTWEIWEYNQCQRRSDQKWGALGLLVGAGIMLLLINGG
jgi:hypothetical protein